MFVTYAPICANASVTNLFSNSMMLQRNKPVPVWGSAQRGETVIVTINGQTKSTTTSSNDKWKVVFNLMPEGGPYTMSIKGNNALSITDIYMREVWYCAGQSNMDTRVSYYPHYSTIQNSYSNAKLRYFTMRQSSANKDGYTTTNVWKTCTSASNIGALSCLGFFFGKDLQSRLRPNIAVGLIEYLH